MSLVCRDGRDLYGSFVTTSTGRRERKKAATRQHIAETAQRLFLQRGFDAVGIRDVAAEADVAVTTVFAHFVSKEALVFARDEEFRQDLVNAATARAPSEPLVPALRAAVHVLVSHCADESAISLWRMIDASPALQDYEVAMRSRHAASLAAAIASDSRQQASDAACRAVAGFVVEAYSIARTSVEPAAAVDEMFVMIEAAWMAVASHGSHPIVLPLPSTSSAT